MEEAFSYARKGYNKKLEKLIKQNKKLLTAKYGEDKDTLLTYAAKYDKYSVIETILEIDTKFINEPDKNNRRPLDYAIINEYIDLIILLLNYDAKITRNSIKLADRIDNINIIYLLDPDKKERIDYYLNIKSKKSQNYENYINKIIELSKEFENKNYYSLGLASIYFSHFLQNFVKPNMYNIKEENVLEMFKKFRKMKFENLENHYLPKLNSITTKNMEGFTKNIQWPHFPLIFQSLQRGSCVDLALMNYMYYQTRGTVIKMNLKSGSNSLLSHINTEKVNKNINNSRILFCMMVFYHVFRTLQIIHYKNYNKNDIESIISTLFYLVEKIIGIDDISKHVKEFLLKRQVEVYKKCISFTKMNPINFNKKPMEFLFKNYENEKKEAIFTKLKEQFKFSLAKKDFFHKYKDHNVLVHPSGFCIYRYDDLSSFSNKYKLKTNASISNKLIYIAYILKTDYSKSGIVYILIQYLKSKKLPIYLEVKKKNEKAYKVYLKSNGVLVGETDTQYLLRFN